MKKAGLSHLCLSAVSSAGPVVPAHQSELYWTCRGAKETNKCTLWQGLANHSPWAKSFAFTFFQCLETSKRWIFHDLWKWHEIHISVSRSEVLLAHSTLHEWPELRWKLVPNTDKQSYNSAKRGIHSPHKFWVPHFVDETNLKDISTFV